MRERRGKARGNPCHRTGRQHRESAVRAAAASRGVAVRAAMALGGGRPSTALARSRPWGTVARVSVELASDWLHGWTSRGEGRVVARVVVARAEGARAAARAVARAAATGAATGRGGRGGEGEGGEGRHERGEGKQEGTLATGRGSIGNQARARLPITSLQVLCAWVLRGAASERSKRAHLLTLRVSNRSCVGHRRRPGRLLPPLGRELLRLFELLDDLLGQLGRLPRVFICGEALRAQHWSKRSIGASNKQATSKQGEEKERSEGAAGIG